MSFHLFKSLLRRGAKRLGYQLIPFPPSLAKKFEAGRLKTLTLGTVITSFLAGRPNSFFVQIGANDGRTGDPMFDVVNRYKLKGLVIEPQLDAFNKLKQTYSHHPQLILERAAISHTNGFVDFFRVSKDFWQAHKFPKNVDTQIASLDPLQIRKHVEIFGGKKLAEDENAYLIKETVPALTFASILEKHQVAHVDILQVDTEGFDYEVLRMLDWNRIKPSVLHFEDVHLNDNDRIAAYTLLEEQGYDLFATDANNTLGLLASPSPPAVNSR